MIFKDYQDFANHPHLFPLGVSMSWGCIRSRHSGKNAKILYGFLHFYPESRNYDLNMFLWIPG